MKTAIEIINERMNEEKNVYFSFDKTNAEGKTLDEIVDEKFDKLDTDFYRVEKVDKYGIQAHSLTSDHPSTIELSADEISTIMLPADVEEFDEELCEVIQF